ncbi:MAG: hypothetical protein ACK5LN_09795 [Propioniciclava sp.]
MFTEKDAKGGDIDADGHFQWVDKEMELCAGYTYTFSFCYVLRMINTNRMFLTPMLLDGAGTNVTPAWSAPYVGTNNVVPPEFTAAGTPPWQGGSIKYKCLGTPTNSTGANGTANFPGAYFATNASGWWIFGTYTETYTAPVSGTYKLRLAWGMNLFTNLTGADGGWAEPTVTCSGP